MRRTPHLLSSDGTSELRTDNVRNREIRNEKPARVDRRRDIGARRRPQGDEGPRRERDTLRQDFRAIIEDDKVDDCAVDLLDPRANIAAEDTGKRLLSGTKIAVSTSRVDHDAMNACTASRSPYRLRGKRRGHSPNMMFPAPMKTTLKSSLPPMCEILQEAQGVRVIYGPRKEAAAVSACPWA